MENKDTPRSEDDIARSEARRSDHPFPHYVDSSCMASIITPPPAHVARHSHEKTSGMQAATHITDPQVPTLSRSGSGEATTSFKHEAPSTSQIQIWISARPRIAPLRDLILATRTNLRREKYRCYQQEEASKELMEDFMAVVQAGFAPEPGSPSYDRLGQIACELKHCNADLKALRERTAGLEDFLSNQEYQLQRVEEDVYRELDEETGRDEPSCEIQLQPSSATVPVNDTMGIRDRLYSRMGDLRIYLERLSNFEYNLQEELDERDILRAAGHVEVSTDTQFFEQSRSERARIQQELDEAQTEVHELKQHCIRAGIEFEEPQFPDMLYHPRKEIFDTATEPLGCQPDMQHGPSRIIGAFFTAQERIKQWLDRPSGYPNSNKEDITEAPEEPMRRESLASDPEWVMPPIPTERRASTRSLGRHGSDAPQWKSGPPPGSPLLEALLLDSASTPLGKYGHQHGTNVALRPRQPLP